jgi:hypothetical protein
MNSLMWQSGVFVSVALLCATVKLGDCFVTELQTLLSVLALRSVQQHKAHVTDSTNVWGS